MFMFSHGDFPVGFKRYPHGAGDGIANPVLLKDAPRGNDKKSDFLKKSDF
jgi:hypothetical protein